MGFYDFILREAGCYSAVFMIVYTVRLTRPNITYSNIFAWFGLVNVIYFCFTLSLVVGFCDA